METIIAMNKPKCDSDYTCRPGVEKFLVQSYAQQIKEQNVPTVLTQSAMLRNSREASLLRPRLTAAMLRDHYIKEIGYTRVSNRF